MTKERKTQKKPHGMDVETGMRLVARHPRQSAHFLSRMLYEETRTDGRFTMKMWLSVASHILDYVAHSPRDAFKSRRIIERVKRLSLKKAVRMALRFPDNGTKVIAVVIYEELANVQGYSSTDIVAFVSMFVGQILDDLKRRNTLS